MKRIALLLCSLLVWAMSFAQTRQVTGVVTDASNQPVPAATVRVKGRTTSTTTNSEGRFSLNVPTGSNTLEISSVGFTNQEATIGANNTISVSLAQNASQMSEVVVTGFGVRKSARKLSYAVQEVKGADLARANTPNLANALQGKVAGVMINQGSGGPTSASRIRIRGNTSLKANTQPLFVIDGVLIQPGTTGADSWGSAQDFGNQVNNLNTDDYESVTVLKGSAASALYGSLAQNGVILITTKKGMARKGLGISVAHTQTFEKAYRSVDVQNTYGGGINPIFEKGADGIDVIDPANYFWSYGPKLDGHTVRDVDGRLVPYSANNDLLAIYETGRFVNTNVAIDGGNERTTFRFSYTNNNNKSILPNNKLDRNNFSLRATQKLSDLLNIDASINYINSKGSNPIRQGGNNNPVFAQVYGNPRHLDIDYWRNHYIDSAGGQLNADEDWYSLAGVFYDIYNNNTTQDEDNLRANIDLNASIKPWLNFLVRGNINSSIINLEQKDWGTGAGYTGGTYRIFQSNSKNARVQALLTGSHTFANNFDLSVTVGGETNRNLGGKSSDSRTNGGLRLPLKFYMGNSVNPATNTTRLLGRSRLDAVYAYGDITWKNMLTFNFSARNDWSSTLTYPDGHGDHSYFYPSAGLAWVFSELTQDRSQFDFLSFGKLRASYGYTGSDAGIFATSVGNYGPNDIYTDVNGTIQRYGFNGNTIGNPNLKNELTKELEVGTDLRFFSNRLGIDLSYYKKNTYNQIIELAAPIESGVSNRQINAGNIQNQGIEILLSTTPIRRKNLEWNANFNFTRNKNKIIELAPGVTSRTLDLAFGADVQSVAKVGEEYGLIQTGYAYAYYQKTDAAGNPVAHPGNGQKLIKTNAAYWRSQDIGQGSKDLGTMMEKFLLSTINNVRYRDFSFGFQIDSKIGGLMASATHQYGSTYGALESTLFGRDASTGGITFTDASGVKRDDGIIPDAVFADGTLLKDPTSGSNVDVGGMSYGEAVQKGMILPIDARRYYARLTQWSSGIREYSVQENSWVALREVSVGYNIPKSVTDRIKLNNLRLSVVGRNLLYLYNSMPDHINPEGLFSNRSGTFAEYGGLPYTRSIGVTLNTAF